MQFRILETIDKFAIAKIPGSLASFILVTRFFKHPRRPRVAGEYGSVNTAQSERAETPFCECDHCLGGDAAAPIFLREPVADFGNMLLDILETRHGASEANSADDTAIIGDCEVRTFGSAEATGDKAMCVIHRIRMRNKDHIRRYLFVVNTQR